MNRVRKSRKGKGVLGTGNNVFPKRIRVNLQLYLKMKMYIFQTDGSQRGRVLGDRVKKVQGLRSTDW